VYEGRVILYPIKPTLEGYRRILSYSTLFTGYKNTLLYTLVGTAINVVLTITAGYALSRKELVGRNVMMMGVMITMIVSGGMIPNYLLVRSLRIYNTMWALILPGAVSTWNLIVTRTFFQQTIPDELREAADLDGCSDTAFFLRVVLPLSASIIAVMVLFYAVSHWNSYFNALIYLSSTAKYPLQLVLRNILIVNTLDDMVNDVATQAAQQRMGDLIKYGMIPEIIGRLPAFVTLSQLDEQSLVHIMTEPKNALVKQYVKLFSYDNVELKFTDDAVRAICKKAIELGTGARGLKTITEKIMLPIMYEVPSLKNLKTVVINEKTINDGEKPQYVYSEET
jgi:putative aldouronate transport system permease protein